MLFRTPFQLKNGIIYDADGKLVKLWGVNYYAPFNHNYFNIQELGKDHFAAINEDFRHFKMMGIDFIRMHLYDREISDPYGNVVCNHQMEVLDYLVERAEQEGIYLMITPIVWWNTINNQIQMDRKYAYWHIGCQQAFGFCNFYSKDALLWDRNALECQKRYFTSLFAHKNKFSGKRLDEYCNIVAIELCNEMQTPWLGMLNDPDSWNSGIDNRGWGYELSHGEQLDQLIGIWKKYKKGKKGTDQEILDRFNHELLLNYGRTMMGIVNKFFGKKTLKAMFGSYSGHISETDKKNFREIGVDLPTLGTYLNFDGFDATNTDRFNHLDKAREWYNAVKDVTYDEFGKVVYEFDASGTLNGYPYAAMGAAYAKFGVQMAAFFTYCPAAVAAWNPGWLVHYLNLLHTPRKAAAFAAAGEIFRKVTPRSKICMEDECWTGKGFSIQRNGDSVAFSADKEYIYSNPTEMKPEHPEKINKIIGHGNGPAAECSGDCCYFLKKTSPKTWELELMPDHSYIRDPLRGKIYRGMANRYISCLTEPAVSILYERKIGFRFLLAETVACRDSSGKQIPLDPKWLTELAPGKYILTVK